MNSVPANVCLTLAALLVLLAAVIIDGADCDVKLLYAAMACIVAAPIFEYHYRRNHAGKP